MYHESPLDKIYSSTFDSHFHLDLWWLFFFSSSVRFYLLLIHLAEFSARNVEWIYEVELVQVGEKRIIGLSLRG